MNEKENVFNRLYFKRSVYNYINVLTPIKFEMFNRTITINN